MWLQTFWLCDCFSLKLLWMSLSMCWYGVLKVDSLVHFYVFVPDVRLYSSIQSLGSVRFFNVSKILLCSPRLHLFSWLKNIVKKPVILWNICIIENGSFVFKYILKCNIPVIKAEFSASLLQSSVSHDPSEIILICWFAAQETFIIIIINVENNSAAFLWKP